jgi:hypothetical protein
MIEILFIITVTLLIASAPEILSVILGNGATMPGPFGPLIDMGPTHFLFVYPSLAFQVWFWTDKMGLFV